MIKSLSPYYLTIPFVSPLTGATCTSFTLKIYVWDGLKLSPPATASYSVTKNNPTNSTGNDKINIARLVNDFIDFEPQQGTATGLYDAVNQRWCKTTITYTTANILDNGVEQLPATALVLKGYGYGMGGENQTIPSNRILLQGNEFRVNRNGFFNLPIILDMTLLERVEQLERVSAVFVPQGAMIAWNKPANTIPAGWQEVVDFKGKTLVGKDDSGIFATLGTNVGSKDAVVVEHTHLTNTNVNFGTGAFPTQTVQAVTGTTGNRIVTESTGVSGTDKNIQPSRIVHFIEFIG